MQRNKPSAGLAAMLVCAASIFAGSCLAADGDKPDAGTDDSSLFDFTPRKEKPAPPPASEPAKRDTEPSAPAVEGAIDKTATEPAAVPAPAPATAVPLRSETASTTAASRPTTPATLPAAALFGRGLRFEYFAGSNFETKIGERIDYKIDSVFGDGSPGTGAPANHFSARWSGYIRAPKAGDYTLDGDADKGFRVLIDRQTVIEFWGNAAGRRSAVVKLTGKPQTIQFEMNGQDGPSRAALYWTPPDGRTDAVVVPGDCFFLDEKSAGRRVKIDRPPGRGLSVTLFGDDDLRKIIRKDVDDDLDWYAGDPSLMAAGVPHYHFSARYHGWLLAPEAGDYSIIACSNDGMRVWMDGQPLTAVWKTGGYRELAAVKLDRKPRELVVEYEQVWGFAWASLHWAKAGSFEEQIIPPSAFFIDRDAAIRAQKLSAADKH